MRIKRWLILTLMRAFFLLSLLCMFVLFMKSSSALQYSFAIFSPLKISMMSSSTMILRSPLLRRSCDVLFYDDPAMSSSTTILRCPLLWLSCDVLFYDDPAMSSSTTNLRCPLLRRTCDVLFTTNLRCPLLQWSCDVLFYDDPAKSYPISTISFL